MHLKRIRTFSRSILGRFVFFSLTMLLLTLFMTEFVTDRSRQVLRDEIVERNAARIASAAEQLTLSLEKSVDILRELLYDTDINRLGVVPGYFTNIQTIFAMRRVSERIFLLANSSTLIEQISLIIPSLGKVITGDGVDELKEGFFLSCIERCKAAQGDFVEMDGEYYVMLPYPTYSSFLKDNDVSYILSMQLSRKGIAQFLASQDTEAEDLLFLFNHDGQQIAQVNRQDVRMDAAPLFRVSQEMNSFETDTAGTHYLVSAAARDVSGRYITLIQLQPDKQAFSLLARQDIFFTALIILIVFANLAYVVHMWKSIHQPLNKLADAFAQTEQGDFSVRLHHGREDDFAGIYHRFNHMNQRLGELIEQAYLQTIRTQRAELKQLQSQINPHFLYNNLFMIRSLAQLGDTDTIETLTADMGEYFRYVTRTGQDEVSLADEVTHARHYAEIQDMRFSSRIALSFPELPQELCSVRVPRLVLQPILENAYQHGLRETASGGRLEVSYAVDGDAVLVVVEDNGQGLTDEKLAEIQRNLDDPEVQETTGLVNIHRRLRLKFGPGSGLTCTRSQMGGLRVIMRLPNAADRRTV